jgi:hypothetical protein
MEFMGVSIGFLALICALVLLFGRHGTRRLLGWTFGLLGAGIVVAIVWHWANEPRQPRLLTDAEVGITAPAAAAPWQSDPVVAPPASRTTAYDKATGRSQQPAWASAPVVQPAPNNAVTPSSTPSSQPHDQRFTGWQNPDSPSFWVTAEGHPIGDPLLLTPQQ